MAVCAHVVGQVCNLSMEVPGLQAGSLRPLWWRPRVALESLCVNIRAPCAHVCRTDLWSVTTDQRSVLRFGCGFAALGYCGHVPGSLPELRYFEPRAHGSPGLLCLLFRLPLRFSGHACSLREHNAHGRFGAAAPRFCGPSNTECIPARCVPPLGRGRCRPRTTALGTGRWRRAYGAAGRCRDDAHNAR
jgi:hypothetical protein